MKISEQIRARREQLGVSVRELAARAQVTEQAVRHWEAGRSYPSKLKSHDVEAALSFTIDWTEGTSVQGRPLGASALIGQGDVELLLLLVRLQPDVKEAIAKLASVLVSNSQPKSHATKTETGTESRDEQGRPQGGRKKGAGKPARRRSSQPKSR